ncbi:MAG: hypothetical protein ACREEE_15315 [Dongiaceae bacterium]
MTVAATPETATASESHDLASAARAIEKIIRREDGESADARPALPATSGGPDHIKSSEAAPESQEHSDDPDDPNHSDESDGGAPDDHDQDEDAAAADGDARYPVKIDGKTEQVGVKELIKGYQRNADYTRKTMRLADERREVEAARTRLDGELAAAEQQRRHHAERVDSLVPNLRQQLSQFDGIDWISLSAENPALYAQARPIHDGLLAQLRQTEAEQLTLQQQARQRQAERLESYQRYLADQKQALVARHPELADPAAGRKETAALTRYLRDSGYRQDELSRLVDHRDFILARKAMLYDRLMANRDQVKATVSSLPRVQRPGTARGDRVGAGEKRAALMRKLARTGRTEDAARLIEEIL